MFRRFKRWVISLFHVEHEREREVVIAVDPIMRPRVNDVFTPIQYVEMYARLWDTMSIRQEKSSSVTWYVNKIKQGRAFYMEVAEISGVPWEVIGCLHLLETGGSFDKVLHNGESLYNVNKYGTRLVPKRRGKNQGWDWQDAAADALSIKNAPAEWTIVNTLHYCERFNGLGYLRDQRKPNSPYIWSFSNHYYKGKYVSDGKYSPTAISKQCGVAPILKEFGFVFYE